MTLYSNSAIPHAVKRMTAITPPIYLFGYLDSDSEPFKFQVSQVALTSNVATLTVQLVSGGGGIVSGTTPYALPQVGAKMGVRGTVSNSGAFNVDPATITAVSISQATGAGTISYALTHANVTAVADVGELWVQPYEVPDLVAAGTASAPVALAFSPDDSDNSRCLFAEAKWFGTLPSAAVVILQAANVDDDARYLALENAQGCAPGATVAASDNLATIAGSAVTQAGAEYSFILGKFLRAKVLSMTGGDGTTGLIVTLFP